MNKTQLIDAVAQEASLSKADAKKAVEAFVNQTMGALKNKDSVTLVGFGSFVVTDRPARTGRNPKTGAPMEIPAKKVIKFRAGSKFTEEVQ